MKDASEQASPYAAPDDVRNRQVRGDPQVVIDVRSAEEYEAGHVPGAQHIPLDQLADRLGVLPVDCPVVTYCTMRHRGDSRGERAAALLREHGIEARALDGGLPAWAAAGFPLERVRRPVQVSQGAAE